MPQMTTAVALTLLAVFPTLQVVVAPTLPVVTPTLLAVAATLPVVSPYLYHPEPYHGTSPALCLNISHQMVPHCSCHPILPISHHLPLHTGCTDFAGWSDMDGEECYQYASSCPTGLNAVEAGRSVSQWANSAGVDASQACCRCGGGTGGYDGTPTMVLHYGCALMVLHCGGALMSALPWCPTVAVP